MIGRFQQVVVIVGLVAACGSVPKGDVTDLGLRVSLEPRDDSSRRALALVLVDEGLPGRALRHLLILDRRGELDRRTQKVLAQLHAERGRARIGLWDARALQEFERAKQLGEVVPTESRARALMVRIASGMRQGQDVQRELTELSAVRPGHWLAAGLSGMASVEQLGLVAVWAWERGANRRGQQLLSGYMEQGGNDSQAVRAWVTASAWWSGGSTRVLHRVRRVAERAGVSLCPLARKTADLNCAASIMEAALIPEKAAEVLRYAGARGWRTADPEQAAAWVSIALSGWIEHVIPSWDDEIRHRVDLAEVPMDRVADFARPTLLRLAGRARESERSLRLSLGATAGLPPTLARVVATEAAARGDDTGRPGSAEETRYQQLLISNDTARIRFGHEPSIAKGRRRMGHKSSGLATQALSELGMLGALKWSPVAPLLKKLEVEYRRDPAISDRIATDFVDAAALPTRRAMAMSAAFEGLGDLERARNWAEHAANESPDLAQIHAAIGRLAARAGDPDRAELAVSRAAGLSGDAGAGYYRAGVVALAHGDALLALHFARRAQALIPGVHRPKFDAFVGRSKAAAGRGEKPQAPLPCPVDPMPTDPRCVLLVAGLDAAASPRVQRAAVWNPVNVDLHRWLILHGNSDVAEEAKANLFIVGLVDDIDTAREALAVLAKTLSPTWPNAARRITRWRDAL